MHSTVTIGEFSKLTHLSVKALRHYHDVGLLEPAEVDRFSGYRRYRVEQAADAQLIRRLRDLEMPVPQVGAVLAAADEGERNRLLAEHLDRVQAGVDRLGDVVRSLRNLLATVAPAPVIEYRQVPAQLALAIDATIPSAAISAWCAQTYPLMYQALSAAGTDPAGAAGATYADEFFSQGEGQVTLFLPIASPVPDTHRFRTIELPAARVAVARHAGSYADIDRTYAALGAEIAERQQSATGPVREIYLIGPDTTDDPDQYRTEVCWPVHPITREEPR